MSIRKLTSRQVVPVSGMTLDRSATLRPGRYVLPVKEKGRALLIEGENLRIDMTDVELTGDARYPWDRHGVGILIRNSYNVELTGGTIRGYRIGIMVENSEEIRLSDCDVSRNFDQETKSTSTRYDPSDWLDIFRPGIWRKYGFGIRAYRCKFSSFSRIKSSNHQNGIGLETCRFCTVQDCDVSDNSGWGVWMWDASECAILGNKADHCVRCESKEYSAGGDSAGIILSNRCCRNVIAHNSFTHSGDGFFLNGLNVDESTYNLIAFNDGSHSPHNAFESTFSCGNTFVGNIASNSRYGMWLGYSYENRIIGNIIENNLFDGIAIEHAHENVIVGNEIRRNRCGIALLHREKLGHRSFDYKITGNRIESNNTGISLEHSSGIEVRGNHLAGNRLSLRCVGECSNITVRNNNILGRGNLEMGDTASADLNDNYWGRGGMTELQRRIISENLPSLLPTRKRTQKFPLPMRHVLLDYPTPERGRDHRFIWYKGRKRLVGL